MGDVLWLIEIFRLRSTASCFRRYACAAQPPVARTGPTASSASFSAASTESAIPDARGSSSNSSPLETTHSHRFFPIEQREKCGLSSLSCSDHRYEIAHPVLHARNTAPSGSRSLRASHAARRAVAFDLQKPLTLGSHLFHESCGSTPIQTAQKPMVRSITTLPGV